VILVLNVGSSSLKYARFDGEREVARDEVDIAGDYAAAVAHALDGDAPSAVGHRVVHGGPTLLAPARIDATVISTLELAVPFAPLHLPPAIAAIRAVRAHLPDVPQVAAFDTYFHRDLPEVARRYALPLPDGVHRYGFHGLSYEYLATKISVPRAVFAHLGSGASLAAVRDGRPIDTTMGLTPTGGIVMATRPGDLDPGLLVYLLDHGHDARSLEKLVNHDGGLRALCGDTDMRKILTRTDDAARLAVDAFCYSVRKAIGAYAAALGGLDAVVFTGGIGAHSSEIRDRVVQPLAFLGAQVHAIGTDEERIVARHTLATL
jgi:acetate kinase